MSSREQLEQYTSEVEAVIGRYLPGEEGYQRTVLEAMNYSMKAGGKRLRPLFMREVYRLFAGGPESEGEAWTQGAGGGRTTGGQPGMNAKHGQPGPDAGSTSASQSRQESGSTSASQSGAEVRSIPSCQPAGGESAVEPFMAAIEMIHTFSLVHDDLPCMDNDTLRRGMDTTWVKYGDDMAVLAGDALALYAFETAAKAFSLGDRPDLVGRCMGLLAEKSGISGMIGGQTADVELTGKAVSPEELDFIYRLKTGALLEVSMMIGAILGGADREQEKAVEKMASCVGTAFQIQDDILDLVGDAQVIGKPVLSDEKNEKTTYVTLYGMEAARKAVMELSGEAEEILGSLPGDHEFLSYLIDILITREK